MKKLILFSISCLLFDLANAQITTHQKDSLQEYRHRDSAAAKINHTNDSSGKRNIDLMKHDSLQIDDRKPPHSLKK